MTSMTCVFPVLTLTALVALLLAEYRGFRPGIWIAKPLASLGFLGGAVYLGALDGCYGATLFAGLVLSFVSDVLLIPKKPLVFRLGIVSFLLAHVAYIAAFVNRAWGLPFYYGGQWLLVWSAASLA